MEIIKINQKNSFLALMNLYQVDEQSINFAKYLSSKNIFTKDEVLKKNFITE